jgi:hypothetical protein
MKPVLVRDLMTVGVSTCKWEIPIVDIARFLLEHYVESMCVLDVKEIESSDKSRVRLSSHKKGDYHE